MRKVKENAINPSFVFPPIKKEDKEEANRDSEGNYTECRHIQIHYAFCTKDARTRGRHYLQLDTKLYTKVNGSNEIHIDACSLFV